MVPITALARSRPGHLGRRGAMSQGCVIGLAVVGVLLLFVLIVGGMVVGKYNTIKTDQTAVPSKWAEIDNQYKRRSDLVEQLVKTVQGAANFEKSTLQSVIDARASVGKAQLPGNLPEDPAKLKAYMDAQQSLSGSLSRLLVVAENYPQLQATAGFRDLQTQIEGTENRIGVARRDYIDAVQRFNTDIATFPGNVVAGLFSFKALPQLEAATPAERQVPNIQFDSGNDKKK